jgi:hypothetical protein
MSLRATMSRMSNQRYLIRNPVIVKGFPIPRRRTPHPGIEIPIEIMSRLLRAQRATVYRDKIYLKGFCSMTVPTDFTGDTIIWHLIFNEDGSHISYGDTRVSGIDTEFTSNPKLADVPACRHIVGWCTRVQNTTGNCCENH